MLSVSDVLKHWYSAHQYDGPTLREIRLSGNATEGDKAVVVMAKDDLLGSFAAWCQSTFEWLVMDTGSGRTVVNFDGEFHDKQDLLDSLDSALAFILAWSYDVQP